MSEQQPNQMTTGSDGDGMDRRKFLLRTTAVTAGAWAAPSILTIDRAFGASGSPTPCTTCGPNTTTDGATVKGTITPLGLETIDIRENACLNDDSPGTGVPLPAQFGAVTLLSATCDDCQAAVSVADALVLLGTTPLVARALQANAACGCTGGATGGSTVAFLSFDGETIVDESSTQHMTIPIPSALGSGVITLNEAPGSGADPGEFNAVHIVYTDLTGNSINLKLASAKATCA